jgi:uncharacterized protein YjbI with pentapeptide repeats
LVNLSYFQYANSSKANIKNAILGNIDFQNANLTGIDFTGAQIISCNFQGANLTDAILRDKVSQNVTWPVEYLPNPRDR